MTRQDHLLVLVAEEATEVALQACKALRFGLEDTKPGEDTATNAVRIVHEFTDLLTVLDMLSKESKFLEETASNLLPSQNERMKVKREKVERLLAYSYTRDRLDKIQVQGVQNE
jgi:transcriptional/translational regulatory protein YebC/TACO1